MATPPKSPQRPAAVKKVAPAVKPVAKATSAATPKVRAPATKPAAAQEKQAPFVIESDTLSSFVSQSDSALPSTGKPVGTEMPTPASTPVAAKPAVTKAAAAKPVAAAPVKTPAPVKQVPVVEKASLPEKAPEKAPIAKAVPAESNASSPPQPTVAENIAAVVDKPAPKQVLALEGHTIMNEAIETSKKFAEDAKSRIQTMVTDFNEKAKVAAEKSSKTAEEFSDIAKGNLEALVESSKIAAKGIETLGQSAAEYGRSSFEKTSATLKSFASVKSPTEFFQLQSELMTSAFDTLASETAKTSEAVLKLAGDIAQPISSRYAVVSDKLKTLAA